MLTNALKEHETTEKFHEALKKCLEDNLKNGKLPDDIVSVSSLYMSTKGKGANLPQFSSDLSGVDLYNGNVLTVHGIWSMRVYLEQLEYKGKQVRGIFKYEVQDHFGLDSRDIDHAWSEPQHWYEKIEGFRSWYLLQHFNGYGYQPFITKIDFEL